MKKLFTAALLISLFVIGCQKNSPATDAANSPISNNAPTLSSQFKILNTLNDTYVREGKNLLFENNSFDAVSYHWDFGNGITSDRKFPSKIAYVPCGGKYTITLTTKNLKGESAVSTKTIQVLCSGKNHGTYIDGQ